MTNEEVALPPNRGAIYQARILYLIPHSLYSSNSEFGLFFGWYLGIFRTLKQDHQNRCAG